MDDENNIGRYIVAAHNGATGDCRLVNFDDVLKPIWKKHFALRDSAIEFIEKTFQKNGYFEFVAKDGYRGVDALYVADTSVLPYFVVAGAIRGRNGKPFIEWNPKIKKGYQDR